MRSLEKCSASAASASLCVSRATRVRARQRTRSTPIDSEDRAEREDIGVDDRRLSPMRRSASKATATARTMRNPVCASAATASILAWPNG